jgi:hypothetical protein
MVPRTGMNILVKRQISCTCRNSSPGLSSPLSRRYTDHAVPTPKNKGKIFLMDIAVWFSLQILSRLSERMMSSTNAIDPPNKTSTENYPRHCCYGNGIRYCVKYIIKGCSVSFAALHAYRIVIRSVKTRSMWQNSVRCFRCISFDLYAAIMWAASDRDSELYYRVRSSNLFAECLQ